MKQRLRLSWAAWRRLAGKLDRGRLQVGSGVRVRYAAAGAGNTLMAKLQELSQVETLKRAEVQPPIFLLGFWRSGTTFLHELFCCDARLGFPSTYACMNPAHFLLTEKSFQQRTTTHPTLRPMDNMQYSWASPQEDEFALLCMGAPSPYEALLAPSLMHDPQVLLDLRRRTREEQERWTEILRLFLRMLSVQQKKTMVLKSPPHGFRLPLLPGLFPQARFVVIDRNPYEVFASNLKLWRTLLEMYSLESFSPQEVEAFVLEAYLIHEEAIREGIRRLAEGRLTRVRYEELVSDPVGQMRRMYWELALTDFESIQPELERHVASVAGHQRNRLALSEVQKAVVEQKWGPLIREKAYEWPDEWVGLETA